MKREMRRVWWVLSFVLGSVRCSPQSPATSEVAQAGLTALLRDSLALVREGSRVTHAQLRVDDQETQVLAISAFDGSEITVPEGDGSHDVWITLMDVERDALYFYSGSFHFKEGIHDTTAHMRIVNHEVTPLFSSEVNGLTVNVRAAERVSSHFVNDVLRFEWNWGDGSSTSEIGLQAASHDYIQPRDYVIGLGVEDYYGEGTYDSTIAACPCPENAGRENEPRCRDGYDDTFNGGCNSTPVKFTSIPSTSTICGETGTFVRGGAHRDTDWYKITVGAGAYVYSGFGEGFVLQLAVLSVGCEIMQTKSADSCTREALTFMGPGTFYLFAAPAAFRDVGCGSKYTISVGPGVLSNVDGDRLIPLNEVPCATRCAE